MRLFNIVALTLTLSLFTLVPIISRNFDFPQVKSAVTVKSSLPTLTAPIASNSAQSIAIFDPQTQTFLLKSNADSYLYPASVTKIATALAAFDAYDLDQVLPVKSAPNTIGHKVELTAGDSFDVLSLLHALLISSGNDAAVTLAENYPGGYAQFIDLMNRQASQIGLKNTHFTNASGLDDPTHQSTASDLTLLAYQLIKNPLLSEIVSLPQKTIYSTSGNPYHLSTTNELLGKNGVVGIKTGWTEAAGENLITLTKRDGHSLIIAVLGSKNRFADSELLINWAFENTTWPD